MTEIDALGAYTPTDENKTIDGVPEAELWSLDVTLTDYILPRIKAFRKMDRKGYPIFDAHRKENAQTDEEWKDLDERNSAEWENILLDIEVAFQLINDREWRSEEVGNEDLHSKATHQKITKGLMLFAKHYEHLWD